MKYLVMMLVTQLGVIKVSDLSVITSRGSRLKSHKGAFTQCD